MLESTKTNYKVAGRSVKLNKGKKSDGTDINANRLERPFIYVEDGVAKVLTVAVFENNKNSYSLFIPLD